MLNAQEDAKHEAHGDTKGTKVFMVYLPARLRVSSKAAVWMDSSILVTTIKTFARSPRTLRLCDEFETLRNLHAFVLSIILLRMERNAA